MIANRLVTIAQDIAGEYKRFGITELLQNASNLSTQRPSQNDNQYRTAIADIKKRAQAILDQNVFRTYPTEILKLLSTSEISTILPNTIANMLIAGFPKRRESAISSAEINMHLAEAQRILGEIKGFISFSDQLGVAPYDIPENKVAIDLKLPRPLFDNKVKTLEKKLSKFTDLFESITELATGSREKVELVYISTTDPVFSLAMVGTAAYAILHFYKLMLEIAEKHISLYKALREFRKSELDISDIETLSQNIEKTITAATNKAIETAFERIPSTLDQSRKSEIRIQIGKQSIEVIADIAAGARIFISLESQQQLELLSSKSGDELESVRVEIEEQKALESRLDRLVFDDPKPTEFLTHKLSVDSE